MNFSAAKNALPRLTCRGDTTAAVKRQKSQRISVARLPRGCRLKERPRQAQLIEATPFWVNALPFWCRGLSAAVYQPRQSGPRQPDEYKRVASVRAFTTPLQNPLHRAAILSLSWATSPTGKSLSFCLFFLVGLSPSPLFPSLCFLGLVW